MRKNQNGYIVVETLGTFIPFVLLIISILSLINIVSVQSKVHYAITQTATTVSMYSYVLEAAGIAEDLMTLDRSASLVTNESDEFKVNISKVFSGIEKLSGDETFTSGQKVTNQVYGWGESIFEDPSSTVQLFLEYGLNEGQKYLFAELVRPLIGRYLSSDVSSGESYLLNSNVINGLDGILLYDFSLLEIDVIGENDSILIDKDGNIKIVVRYDIAYKFGSLPLPFDPKISITQVVKTKAWLNGSGKGYW